MPNVPNHGADIDPHHREVVKVGTPEPEAQDEEEEDPEREREVDAEGVVVKVDDSFGIDANHGWLAGCDNFDPNESSNLQLNVRTATTACSPVDRMAVRELR